MNVWRWLQWILCKNGINAKRIECFYIIINQTDDIERISWFKTIESDSQERESPNESQSERNHWILYSIWERWTRYWKQIQWWITNQRFYFKICRWKPNWINQCWNVFQQQKSHDLMINISRPWWRIVRNIYQWESTTTSAEQKNADLLWNICVWATCRNISRCICKEFQHIRSWQIKSQLFSKWFRFE